MSYWCTQALTCTLTMFYFPQIFCNLFLSEAEAASLDQNALQPWDWLSLEWVCANMCRSSSLSVSTAGCVEIAAGGIDAPVGWQSRRRSYAQQYDAKVFLWHFGLWFSKTVKTVNWPPSDLDIFASFHKYWLLLPKTSRGRNPLQIYF